MDNPAIMLFFLFGENNIDFSFFKKIFVHYIKNAFSLLLISFSKLKEK